MQALKERKLSILSQSLGKRVVQTYLKYGEPRRKYSYAPFLDPCTLPTGCTDNKENRFLSVQKRLFSFLNLVQDNIKSSHLHIYLFTTPYRVCIACIVPETLHKD